MGWPNIKARAVFQAYKARQNLEDHFPDYFENRDVFGTSGKIRIMSEDERADRQI